MICEGQYSKCSMKFEDLRRQNMEARINLFQEFKNFSRNPILWAVFHLDALSII